MDVRFSERSAHLQRRALHLQQRTRPQFASAGYALITAGHCLDIAVTNSEDDEVAAEIKRAAPGKRCYGVAHGAALFACGNTKRLNVKVSRRKLVSERESGIDADD